MRGLLLKPWNGYQPGQVLTQHKPAEIPADSVLWYGDEEIIPVLPVRDGAIDPNSPELAVKFATAKKLKTDRYGAEAEKHFGRARNAAEALGKAIPNASKKKATKKK